MDEIPSILTRVVTEEVKRLLQGDASTLKLNRALRQLAKWRAELLANTLLARSGNTVLGGPFAGMTYGVRATEGSRTARCLGSYEAALAPVIETIVSRDYGYVIDVGCAEGYYAVGLARRMPKTRVLACDADPGAQAACRKLAEMNGVLERVRVQGRMDHDGFVLCETQKCVVICDIEGAEEALLDPVAAPGLRHADILVEVHDCMKPGLSNAISGRFSQTHRIMKLDRRIDASALPAWTEELSDLDRLLALWEWRAGPTPWLWMERK